MQQAEPRTRRKPGRWGWSLVAVVGALLFWSAIGPRDRMTWWLEVAPVLIGAPMLLATRERFPLTPLVVIAIAVHAAILIVGGHYTYAEVPAGNWVRDALGLERNPYDRLGHFAQGFVPALIAREILLRKSPLRRGGWLFFLVTCVCLSISALYELVEWWAALATGEAAMAFLGTQGDVWDTQWDMFMALLGAIAALLTLSKVHDRQLAHER
jgi:putative membrane protein